MITELYEILRYIIYLNIDSLRLIYELKVNKQNETSTSK